MCLGCDGYDHYWSVAWCSKGINESCEIPSQPHLSKNGYFTVVTPDPAKISGFYKVKVKSKWFT